VGRNFNFSHFCLGWERVEASDERERAAVPDGKHRDHVKKSESIFRADLCVVFEIVAVSEDKKANTDETFKMRHGSLVVLCPVSRWSTRI
jgi:hypothetical protein